MSLAETRAVPSPSPADKSARDRSGAVLRVDLGAVRANYRLLKSKLGRADCAAVVKADAYGLGADRVAPALSEEGCRRFFVAHVDEGIALRPHLPAEAEIIVLHGLHPGAEKDCLEHRLVPVLNSLAQIDAWRTLARGRAGKPLPAVVQVDSGMARMGLPDSELQVIAGDPQRLAGIELCLVMGHLACGDEPDHPANAFQLARFIAARRMLPLAPASFANSAGIFLGSDYHFDLVRPGVALYGCGPLSNQPNPMNPVVRLQGKVVQLRSVPPGTPIGYSWTHRVEQKCRVATVSVGYADGFLRSLSGRACAYFGDVPLPLIGRVSMDSITLDASALPDGALTAGAFVDLIGPHETVDAVAARAGTIGYEILTSLGQRYFREYIDV